MGITPDFELMLDVTHFGDYAPKEITVRLIENYVEITGNQEWRSHPGGSIKRSFSQRHILPRDCDADKLTAYMMANGVLMIRAPRHHHHHHQARHQISIPGIPALGTGGGSSLPLKLGHLTFPSKPAPGNTGAMIAGLMHHQQHQQGSTSSPTGVTTPGHLKSIHPLFTGSSSSCSPPATGQTMTSSKEVTFAPNVSK